LTAVNTLLEPLRENCTKEYDEDFLLISLASKHAVDTVHEFFPDSGETVKFLEKRDKPL